MDVQDHVSVLIRVEHMGVHLSGVTERFGAARAGPAPGNRSLPEFAGAAPPGQFGRHRAEDVTAVEGVTPADPDRGGGDVEGGDSTAQHRGGRESRPLSGPTR